MRQAERMETPEKGCSLWKEIIFTHRDDYLFILDFYSWTSNSFCLHDQQKGLLTCSAQVPRCHNTSENVLRTISYYKTQTGESIIMVYLWQPQHRFLVLYVLMGTYIAGWTWSWAQYRHCPCLEPSGCRIYVNIRQQPWSKWLHWWEEHRNTCVKGICFYFCLV